MNHTADELDTLRAEAASLRAEVASLRAEVASLRREEQPMPVGLPGAVPVLPLVHRTLGEILTPRHPQMGAILALLNERTAKGVATYKIALMAPNGRDFIKDATEEAADLVQYLAGLRHLRDYDPRRLRLLHALVSVAYNQTTLALAEAESKSTLTTTRPPAVRFTVRGQSAVLTVGGFRVAITPTGDDVVDLAFSGLGAPAALHRLGIELRCASVRWADAGFIFDALRSRDHEPGMADGDVLASVGCVNGDPGRVLVTVAIASDPYADTDVEIASMPDGRCVVTSEVAGFGPAQMGAIGSILEAVGRPGAVGCLLTTVRDAARGCGCEDLDAALAEMADEVEVAP